MEEAASADTGTAQANTNAEGSSVEGAGVTKDTTTGTQAQVTSWRDGWSDDLKGNEALKAYEKPDDLAKAYLELSTGKTQWETEKAGWTEKEKQIEADKAKWTEEKTAFEAERATWEKEKAELTGKIPKAPEKPEAYEINVPEGIPVDDGFMKGFREVAHGVNLTQDQVAKLSEWHMGLSKQYMEAVAAQEKQAKDAEAAETESLRKEWGTKDFDSRKDRAVKMAQKVFDEKSSNFYAEAGFFDDPLFLRGMDKIAEVTSDDVFVEGKRTGEKKTKYSASGTPMLNYENSPTMPKPG